MKLVKIISSGRKNKKYVAIFKLTDGSEKKVHFGQKGARDYTRISDRKSSFYIKDKTEREKVKAAYISRHSKEKWTSPDTAGSLSRYILWELPTMAASIKAFKKRFGV
tara:strand:- start:698 stop:1021 length:324 start_codon:yes stop_codon:yes gene_type:complete